MSDVADVPSGTERWVYEIDPGFNPDGIVPPNGIIGARERLDDGSLGSLLANPRYEPSPIRRMMDTNEDGFVRAAASFRQERESVAEFLDRFDHWAFLHVSNDPKQVFIANTPRGKTVQAFSSEPHIVDRRPGDALVEIAGKSLREIARSGCDVEVNPGPNGSLLFGSGFIASTP